MSEDWKAAHQGGRRLKKQASTDEKEAGPEGEVIQRWEPPDTLVSKYKGHVDGHHVRKATEVGRRLVDGARYHLLLIDVTELAAFSADARKAAAEAGDGSRTRGVAIVGASFHFKALGTLVAKAAALLYRVVDNPIRFFDTGDEARVWLTERRREIGAAEKPPR